VKGASIDHRQSVWSLARQLITAQSFAESVQIHCTDIVAGFFTVVISWNEKQNFLGWVIKVDYSYFSEVSTHNEHFSQK
jgi:hypothetical protein